MHARFQNWPIALNREITRAATLKFKYGTHDCALFAADCVRAMTGTDLMGDLRARYATREQAEALLEEYFGGDLERAMLRLAEQYAIEEITPLFAQRGDLVMRTMPEGPALGVLSGRLACFAAPRGLAMLTIYECRRAWRI